MLVLQERDFNRAYPQMIQHVMEKGDELDSRVARVKEIHPAVISVSTPQTRLVTAVGRPINVAFALAEALWILQGREDVAMLAAYNSRISDYSDDGSYFNAAYGARLRSSFGLDQIEDVIRTLAADPQSRQATLVMSHPGKDRGWKVNKDATGYEPHVTKDRACNVLAHLLIRPHIVFSGPHLEWLQIVRSNDALWGTPYNWMQFTHLQEYIATRLGLEMGQFTHVVDSLHIYDYHWGEAQSIEHFDLYSALDWWHPRMEDVSDVTMHKVYETERKIRQGYKYEMPDVPAYWCGVLEILQAHVLYHKQLDGAALRQCAAATDKIYGAAQARFFYTNRWYRDEYRSFTKAIFDRWGDEVGAWITRR